VAVVAKNAAEAREDPEDLAAKYLEMIKAR
jgi:hypothetical protein